MSEDVREEQNFVEALRQPLNNIGLAAGIIKEGLEREPTVQGQIVLHYLDRITANVERADKELVEWYERLRPRIKPDDWWAEDEAYPADDWRYEVAENDTRLGYWEWVAAKREADSEGEA